MQKQYPNIMPLNAVPWRPPEWKGLPSSEEEFTGQNANGTSTGKPVGQILYLKTNIGGYFFDAFLRVEHSSSLKITSHPVQSGANISDHAYMEPVTLVMEVGMSDAMDSLIPNQFKGFDTKSVTAYNVLTDLQESRVPFEVHTRLKHYTNMLIENISTADDFKTMNGLRCTVTMKQILLVDVAKTTVSARNQATGSTQQGIVQSTPVPPTIAALIEERYGSIG
jgi:hypothetical protein